MSKVRGYRTARDIIAMAYLIVGKLRFDGPEPLWGSLLGSATMPPAWNSEEPNRGVSPSKHPSSGLSEGPIRFYMSV